MPNLNKVMLMGNLTRDVELRQIPSGQQVANLGLAINRRYKTKDNEDREETTFVDCEAWGRQAEVLAQYMSKGKPLYIEGRLKLDTWDDKDGKKQYKMRVVIEDFQFLGSREGGEGGGGGGGGGGRSRSRGGDDEYAPSAPASRGGSRGAGGGGHVAPQDDDIPF